MNATEARRRLERLVPPAVAPELTDDEVLECLAAGRRPSIDGALPTNVEAEVDLWAPNTSYPSGSVVRDSAGRYWRALISGTSSSSTTFPDLAGCARSAHVIVREAAGPSWVDAGPEWSPTWDLNAAALAGWELKAAKATELYSATVDGMTLSRAQIAAHCAEMAERYRRRLAGTVSTS